MSIQVKSLKLQDYYGYRDITFDFVDSRNQIIPMSVFFGPNGIGKSTGLDAMKLFNTPKLYAGRDTSLYFRKMVYHPDYNPSMGSFEYELARERAGKDGQEFKWPYKMVCEATFLCDGQERKMKVTDRNGLEIDELEHSDFIFSVDADKPSSNNQFQLEVTKGELFINLAQATYGYDVSLVEDSKIETRHMGDKAVFYHDFTIKKGSTLVHYKSMSAGEKKIATLLRQLCSSRADRTDIFLIDNIEMHVYFKRHPVFIDKILEIFPNKQFLVSTHSMSFLKHVQEKYDSSWLFDIEKYKPDMATYNVPEYI